MKFLKAFRPAPANVGGKVPGEASPGGAAGTSRLKKTGSPTKGGAQSPRRAPAAKKKGKSERRGPHRNLKPRNEGGRRRVHHKGRKASSSGQAVGETAGGTAKKGGDNGRGPRRGRERNGRLKAAGEKTPKQKKKTHCRRAR